MMSQPVTVRLAEPSAEELRFIARRGTPFGQ